MLAKLYQVTHPKPLWQVVYTDAAQRAGGRARRVRKHFVDESKAREYLREINAQLAREGTAGIAFDARLRADAVLARELLDGAGFVSVRIAQAVQAWIEATQARAPERRFAETALQTFLHEKQHVEGCAERTVRTLRNRLEKWLHEAGVMTLDELTRPRVEAMRMREGVQAQTRRNDMAALSVWCTWLLDKGWIGVHPLRGLRRPKLPPAKKATFSAEEIARLLRAAQEYRGGVWLGTLAVMVWTGCRPSELAETRLTYGRQPIARIEGGKLRGRANRTVPLSPAARAWLAQAGNPATVAPLNSRAHQAIAALAELQWSPDVTRHTYISNRVALLKDDAAVALEAGTSQEMIHRHYHALKLAREARDWAGLRP